MVVKAFIPDGDFEREFLTNEGNAEWLLPIAEAVADEARSIAPVRLEHYKKSIEAVAGMNEKGIVVGRVNAHDFKAVWIEKGTGPPVPSPPFAPLGLALQRIVGG